MSSVLYLDDCVSYSVMVFEVTRLGGEEVAGGDQRLLGVGKTTEYVAELASLEGGGT